MSARFKMSMSSKCCPRWPTNGVDDDVHSTLQLDKTLAEDTAQLMRENRIEDGDSDDDSDNQISK